MVVCRRTRRQLSKKYVFVNQSFWARVTMLLEECREITDLHQMLSSLLQYVMYVQLYYIKLKFYGYMLSKHIRTIIL